MLIIAHEEFPIPRPSLPFSQALPSSPSQAPSTIAETSSQYSTNSSYTTNKENTLPVAGLQSGELPPQALAILSSISSTLKTYFSKTPPHTVQRLAELVLSPKQHHHTLPSYLHAVDRVVHVTSGVNVFPLPPPIHDPAILSNGAAPAITWSRPTPSQQPSLGSDESLGGALLTPILWLNKNGNGNSIHSPLEGEVKTESTEMVEGPNGLGGVETVSVSVNGISSPREATGTSTLGDVSGGVVSLRAEGGVTQGELLRQEQRAGVVPATQLAGHRADMDVLGEEDETPHARGPDEIGMEDMGPQSAGVGERAGPPMAMQGINVEAAVGRRAGALGVAKPEAEEDIREEMEEESGEAMGEDVKSDAGTRPSVPKREAEEQIGSDGKRLKGGGKDIVIVDTDGKEEDEEKIGESGENKRSDAVDTTAQ
ncbi:hypothetical protein B7494_g910 [Chlorociboria aeruginascens]|nr:hypothetical protein B7494_g910 [Chlorociboria aeruginascens]